MEFQQKVLVKTSIGWQKGLFWRNQGKALEIRVVTMHGLPYEAMSSKAGEFATVVVKPSQVRVFGNQSDMDGETWLTK